jgi:hypothetical protein
MGCLLFFLPRLNLHFVDGKLAIGKQRIVYLLVFLQLLIFPQELKDLLNNFSNLILNLIKHPMVVAPKSKNAGIFQIDQVPGSFRLRKIQNLFQVGDTHFAVGKDEMKDADARFVGTSLKYLRTESQVETFKAHSSSSLVKGKD